MNKPISLSHQMSKSLISLRWDSPMQQAFDLMEQRQIRHLPLVDSEGLLCGILSDRDVKRAMDPNFPGFKPGFLAGDFMSWPVLTVEQNTPLFKAVKRMIEEKISALLVTQGGVVMGIVTTEDLLRLLQDFLLKGGKGRETAILDFTYEPLWRQLVNTASTLGL